MSHSFPTVSPSQKRPEKSGQTCTGGTGAHQRGRQPRYYSCPGCDAQCQQRQWHLRVAYCRRPGWLSLSSLPYFGTYTTGTQHCKDNLRRRCGLSNSRRWRCAWASWIDSLEQQRTKTTKRTAKTNFAWMTSVSTRMDNSMLATRWTGATLATMY